MKKFLSIAVAIVMVLSLSVVAFADTTIASESLSGSATLTCTNGVDFTDESLSLEIYFTMSDSSYVGWGPLGICDSGWNNVITVDTDASYSLNEDGVISIPLTVIADAFTAAGYDVADGIVLNWWADGWGATLTGAAVVSSSDAAASADEDVEETGETEEDASSETVEAVEETTEATTEETTTAASPSTGVALALVPMAIAGIAVVSSKRR
ncbi:MAG: hypothetical protein LUH18_03480 [Oscillospiraceae bacterium]|nr:hypothetical protein [Oscillospiraceae bacterium]